MKTTPLAGLRRLIVASALLVTLSARAAYPYSPANPNATAAAKDVLGYLQTLAKGHSNRLLIGQFAGYPNANNIPGNSISLQPLQDVFNATGKWPALIGVDYGGRTTANDTNTRLIDYGPANTLATNYWNAGGLVLLTLHIPNPDPAYLNPTTLQGGNMRCNLGPPLPLDHFYVSSYGQSYTNWRAELDKVAQGLQVLENAGVVVLLRPLHEMGTASWWWGKPSSTDSSYAAHYKGLYRDMFNYLTVTKGLNNILWVFGPKNGSYSLNSQYADLYPGDDVVDIIGTDVYKNPTLNEADIGSSATGVALALGKVFALHEYGPTTAPVDLSTVLSNIKSNAPENVFWHEWHDAPYALALQNNLSAMIADPWIITRDEVNFSGKASALAQNAAATATVTASSSNPSFPVSGANDGNRWDNNAKWCSAAGVAGPHTLTFQWPTSKTIAKVLVWSGATTATGYQVVSYQVQSWNGSAWSTVATVTNNTEDGYYGYQNVITFPAVNTTGIRLYITSGSNIAPTDTARILEVEMYPQ